MSQDQQYLIWIRGGRAPAMRQPENSAPELRRGTLAEGTRIAAPGERGKPVEMRLRWYQTERTDPVETGLGEVVLFLFRFESLEDVVPAARPGEGGLSWGMDHGIEKPPAERLSLIRRCREDAERKGPRGAEE